MYALRSVFAALLLFVSSFAAAATDSVPNLSNPNLVKVTDRIYAMIGDMDVFRPTNQGFVGNSAFVITDDGVVVVDTGGTKQVGELIIEQIRRLTDKPITHVFNTHHHADHWMGNQAFAQLSPRPVIMAHPHTRQTIQDVGETWVGIVRDMTQGANEGTAVVVPDVAVNGDEVFEIGGLTFQLYHPAHAHTEGDIAVYVVEEKTLLSGDIVFHQRAPGWQDASPTGNEQALHDLEPLAVEHLVPGHGPVTDGSGIQYMLTYIETLRGEVAKYFEQGLQDFEMRDKVDVGPYKAMAGYDERIGVNVNRMFLEVEAGSL